MSSSPEESGKQAEATEMISEQEAAEPLAETPDGTNKATAADGPIAAARGLTETRDLSWEEYKLVQDKLDKIGDFHFRVRTWAITLISAIAVGGFVKELPWYIYLVGPLSVFSFQMIDYAQSQWQAALMRRISQLERSMRVSSKSGPRVAQVLRQGDDELKAKWWKWPIRAHRTVFYGVMYSLSFGAMGLAYRASSKGEGTALAPAVVTFETPKGEVEIDGSIAISTDSDGGAP